VKKIYTSADVLQCSLRKAILEACGIRCQIRNEGLTQLYGQVPFTAGWPEVWVLDDGRYEEAQAILARHRPPAGDEEISLPAAGDPSCAAQPVSLRAEGPDDASGIRYVHTSAFGGPVEAGIVDALRERGCVTLSLVAVCGKTVVGHVLFSPVRLEPRAAGLTAVGLAPIAVLPEYQCRGIGTWLAVSGLERLRAEGVDAVVVVGNPAFYRRLGFQPASRLGLKCEYEVADEEFMALALGEAVSFAPDTLALYQPEFREL
jgi:putative acetyltransferase